MTISAGVQAYFGFIDGAQMDYAGPNSTDLNQLTFSKDISYGLMFTGPTDNLTAADFTLVTTGTATADIARTIATKYYPATFLTPASTAYFVHLENVAGAGTIKIEFAEPGHLATGMDFLPLTIETTPPELLSTDVLTPAADYASGAQITFQVNFDERIAVKGLPSLLLSNGAEAVYVGGSGTSALQFTYAVQANQAATDNLTVVGFHANNATTTDVAGNAVDWTDLHVARHAPIAVHPETVAAPAFTAMNVVTSTGSDVLQAGDTVTFNLTIGGPFAFADHVFTSTPILTLSNGAVATFSGLHQAVASFAYHVSDGDPLGPVSVTGLNLNRVTVQTIVNVGFDAAHPMAVMDGTTALHPSSVFIADLDRDGHNDIVTLDARDHKISVMLGHGDGSFDAAVNYAVGLNPDGVTFTAQNAGIVADLNGDGIPDIATADINNLSVFIGNGDGTFAAPVQTRISANLGMEYISKLSTVNLADGVRLVVDGGEIYQRPPVGDGRPFDGFFAYTSLNFFTSDATGHLIRDNHLTSVPIAGGVNATLLDFDGDGRLDIAGASDANRLETDYIPPNGDFREGNGRVSVTYGIDQVELNGKVPGVTSPWTDGIDPVYWAYDTRLLPRVTVAAQLGGGPIEFARGTLSTIIAAGANELSTSIIFNTGGGLNCTYYSSAADPTSIKVVDVDGDGAPDILIAGLDSQGQGVLSVFYNEGNGHFYDEQVVPLPDFGTRLPRDLNVDAIATGDIDGDGKPDVVSVVGFLTSASPGITILHNHSVPGVLLDESSIAPLLAQQPTLTIGADTRAPDAPSTPVLSQASDSGVSDSDGRRTTGVVTQPWAPK